MQIRHTFYSRCRTLCQLRTRWTLFKSITTKIIDEQHRLCYTYETICQQLQRSYQREMINQLDYYRHMGELDILGQEIKSVPQTRKAWIEWARPKEDMIQQLAQWKTKLLRLACHYGSTDLPHLIRLFFNDSRFLSMVQNDPLFDAFQVFHLDTYYETVSPKPLERVFKQPKKNRSILVPKDNEYHLVWSVMENPSWDWLKIYGAKVQLVCSESVLVVAFGYFDLKRPSLWPIEGDPKFPLDFTVPADFQRRWWNGLSKRDHLVFTVQTLWQYLQDQYIQWSQWKGRTISEWSKQIDSCSITEIRRFVYCALISSDSREQSLGLLLFDLWKSRPDITHRLVLLLYDSFPWAIKKLLQPWPDLSSQKNELKLEEETSSYERRIVSVLGPPIVRVKALEKWKEIGHAKTGETNAKAQQYLDGLLKIPFACYKQDFLKVKWVDFIHHFRHCLNQCREDLESIRGKSLQPYWIEQTLNWVDSTQWKGEIQHPTHFLSWWNRLETWKSQPIGMRLIELYPNLGKGWFAKLPKSMKAYFSKQKKKDTMVYADMFVLLRQIFPHSGRFCTELDGYRSFCSHLDQIQQLWQEYTKIQDEYFETAAESLDQAVYGSTQAKDQIMRLLGQWVYGKDNGYVFGIEGPPGTGKTTLAKMGIANCLRDEMGKPRPMIFIPLGGSANGSTLEGHNYTYVGSTWGKIVDGLMESQCMNPIIYIDELDKISKTEHGKELIGILTHLTDPAQNSEFTDKFFSGIPIDLSKALIIFSYNDAELIDRILLDRIQRITIDPLHTEDKLIVAKKHILPQIFSSLGLQPEDIEISDESLRHLIDTYTMEAGVRRLKERLYEILRTLNLDLILRKQTIPIYLTPKTIDEILSHYYKQEFEKVLQKDEVGIINGLFATGTGVGGVLLIECSRLTTSEFKLTGLQGDVMKESMNVAKTLALQYVDISGDPGFHIHCPEGATPKDGPSAGAAITLALISLLTQRPVNHLVAITGEIDLQGRILPIGGLGAKIEGASRSGIQKVLYPKKNQFDFDQLKKKNQIGSIECVSIETLEQAVFHCLSPLV